MTKKEIEERLKILPKGAITTKRIKNKNDIIYEYKVLQWSQDGKQENRIIKGDEFKLISSQLEERKALEIMLKNGDYNLGHDKPSFYTNVITSTKLLPLVEEVKGYKKRNGYNNLNNYIYNNFNGKVFILYGLRRTGKTTLIEQIIADMKYEVLMKTAFIQITKKDSFADFNKDLKTLQERGYKYVFIDEVTLMQDFIEGAALLSDIYASSGMKIVLSGTDSLGFWITKSNELYDRSIMLHTTFIPYKEFSQVLGINGIDDYIQYGGTMSVSGHHYNIFDTKETTDEYIDSAIAYNIQHSLKFYQYEGHFRHLYDLYEKNELTSAINRVVEDMNHRFTIEVLERDFKSSDLKLSSNNLRKDKTNPTTILDDIDIASFTSFLKELLEIKDKNEQSIKIDNIHIKQIQEYLEALDLIDTIEIVDIDVLKDNKKRIVFTQPGLRYSQAKSLVLSLKEDPLFKNQSIEEQKRIIDRILNEIKGRMAEDIILLETKLAYPKKNVFKLQFANGEFDMVISDEELLESEIYEIKYSKEIVSNQTRHLIDEDKCKATAYRFGKIIKKSVLYRGENKTIQEIIYQNIEDYLNNLK